MADVFLEDVKFPVSLVEEKSILDRMKEERVDLGSHVELILIKEVHREVHISSSSWHIRYSVPLKEEDINLVDGKLVGYVNAIAEPKSEMMDVLIGLTTEWQGDTNEKNYLPDRIVQVDAIQDYKLVGFGE